MRSADELPRPELYGIIGYPLRRTWSPELFNTAFRIQGSLRHYAPFAMAPGALGRGVEALSALGVKGFNVTVPHKEAIFPLLRSSSELARTLGAVNTVVRKPRGWHGENTDVHGFATSLWRFKRKLAGRAAVVIGAGGAARAVVYALVRHFDMSGVLVLARRRARAENFARWAQSLSPGAAISGLKLAGAGEWRAAFARATLVVNATPAGKEGEAHRLLPVGSPFHRDQIAYDLGYAQASGFLKLARARGAETLDGRRMLLEQAALAFRLFTGETFPARKVLAALKGTRRWPID